MFPFAFTSLSLANLIALIINAQAISVAAVKKYTPNVWHARRHGPMPRFYQLMSEGSGARENFQSLSAGKQQEQNDFKVATMMLSSWPVMTLLISAVYLTMTNIFPVNLSTLVSFVIAFFESSATSVAACCYSIFSWTIVNSSSIVAILRGSF
jgi:hypothetical protein